MGKETDLGKRALTATALLSLPIICLCAGNGSAIRGMHVKSIRVSPLPHPRPLPAFDAQRIRVAPAATQTALTAAGGGMAPAGRFIPMRGHTPPIFPAVRVFLGTRTRTRRGAPSRPDAQRDANGVARGPYGAPLGRRIRHVHEHWGAPNALRPQRRRRRRRGRRRRNYAFPSGRLSALWVDSSRAPRSRWLRQALVLRLAAGVSVGGGGRRGGGASQTGRVAGGASSGCTPSPPCLLPGSGGWGRSPMTGAGTRGLSAAAVNPIR